MISFVHLEAALNALSEAKNNSEHQDENCHPECVPLYAVAAIMPPLRKCSWGGIVKGLFEDHEAVPPELELFNLARFSVQSAAFGQPPVQDTSTFLFVILTYFAQPLLLVSLAPSRRRVV